MSDNIKILFIKFHFGSHACADNSIFPSLGSGKILFLSVIISQLLGRNIEYPSQLYHSNHDVSEIVSSDPQDVSNNKLIIKIDIFCNIINYL